MNSTDQHKTKDEKPNTPPPPPPPPPMLRITEGVKIEIPKTKPKE